MTQYSKQNVEPILEVLNRGLVNRSFHFRGAQDLDTLQLMYIKEEQVDFEIKYIDGMIKFLLTSMGVYEFSVAIMDLTELKGILEANRKFIATQFSILKA